MGMAIFVYSVIAVSIFLTLGLIPQVGSENDKRMGARMMLISPIWPIVLVVAIGYYVIEGVKYIWKTADLGGK